METGRKSKQDEAWVRMGWGDAICSSDVRGVAAFVGIEYSALTLQDSSPALSELVSSQVELGPSQRLLDRREVQTPELRNERALGDVVIPRLEPSLSTLLPQVSPLQRRCPEACSLILFVTQVQRWLRVPVFNGTNQFSVINVQCDYLMTVCVCLSLHIQHRELLSS